MSPSALQLSLTPSGLMLAGNLLAKRAPNGTLELAGHEDKVHALLSAAYAKPISQTAMKYINRAGTVLADVKEEDWESRTPHSARDVPVLAKAHMLLVLAGLNAVEDSSECSERLAKAQSLLKKGMTPEALLKSYLLAKDDDGGDDEEDDDEDDGDDSDSEGDDDFDSKHPRWPAGSPDGTGGEFKAKDGSPTPDSGSGSISTDDIRNAIEDGMNSASSLPQGTQVAGDGEVFENREGRLPIQPMGYYTISVIPTAGIAGAGQQRIITGQGGEAYYTSDHYKTFTQIK